jgi:isocitrate dehydrogenase (NAD+)
MSFNITFIKGDGIGPEISDLTIKLLNSTGLNFNFEFVDAGLSALEKYKTTIPDSTLHSIDKNKIAIKGPLTTPVGEGFKSVNVTLRKEFKLYANIRPIKSIKGVNSLYQDLDIVFFRENLEEFYAGIEHYIDDSRSAGVTVGIITQSASEKIAKAAFEFALKNNRKKVTVVHKANILKCTNGVFLNAGRRIKEQYPQIQWDEKIVDNFSMQLVMNPYQFDVVYTTNLFGDILTDLASGLIGGLGFAPSVNMGENHAIFEPVHGSAPDIAGKNLTNPTSMFLSAALMLEYLEQTTTANNIRTAISNVIQENKFVTKDINPNNYVTSDIFTNRVIEEYQKISS